MSESPDVFDAKPKKEGLGLPISQADSLLRLCDSLSRKQLKDLGCLLIACASNNQKPSSLVQGAYWNHIIEHSGNPSDN